MAAAAAVELTSHRHGKGTVRVATVRRDASGVQHFSEIVVNVLLDIPKADKSYTRGDNSCVVATDTCKNNINMMAKRHGFSSPEGGQSVAWLILISFLVLPHSHPSLSPQSLVCFVGVTFAPTTPM
jgi:urate oxidase